ncbi:MAG: DUF1015 domain-containing protein [Pseudomonadota bacterium]
MAKIVPFRGIVYNPERVENLASVATPPYDVITSREQLAFYEHHPWNIIRLILGKTSEKDTPQDNRHTRSAGFFNAWQSEGVLIQDPSPAFYLTSIDFSVQSRKITRWGVISLVALEPFDKGVVLPHEKTFSRVKSERLELMKSCHANYSPIFSLYSDAGQLVLNTLRQSCTEKTPDMKFVDTYGHLHQLWRVTDVAVHRRISDFMNDKSIFIADGHHRYETALNYRQWIADRTPGFSPEHPANFIMMYLCGMEDPGLVILPAHRMVKAISPHKLDSFIIAAEACFDITRFTLGIGTGTEQWDSMLNAGSSHTRIGVVIRNHPQGYLLSLKPGVMQRMFGHEMSERMLELDVTVLTRLILMELLGLNHGQLDDESIMSYSSKMEVALEAVGTGDCDAAFILNSTRIDQVKRIAEAGEIMPRKSTYFYPKVITGQVLNRLSQD